MYYSNERAEMMAKRRPVVQMSESAFNILIDWLLDNGYDYKEIGISNLYVSNITGPEFGIRLLNWHDRMFEVTDEKKYLIFTLRHT